MGDAKYTFEWAEAIWLKAIDEGKTGSLKRGDLAIMSEVFYLTAKFRENRSESIAYELREAADRLTPDPSKLPVALR